MHGTLKAEAGAEQDALFFAELSDSPEIMAVPAFERSAYGTNTGPSWSTIIAIALVHVVVLYGLVKFDVIQIAPKKKPLVVELIAEPPAPPADKPEPEPVVVEKVQPVIEIPPPIVQTLAPPPPQITVTSTPPPPKPVTVAAPPPSGPVAVGDLDERLIDYALPRYPLESRKRKEQGTVMLRLLIGTDGRVAEVSIAQSCGFERLDQAILQAVRKWRWKPMTREGQPVEMRAVMPFTWNIA